MTAQEALNILNIETPFSPVELKSAHKKALVTWFPAQFMNDRAALSKALEQTALVHEAYEVLKEYCEQEAESAPNPYVEEAMKLAYGKGSDASSTRSAPESGTAGTWDPLPLDEPAAAQEAGAVSATPATSATPLAEAERPRETGRVPTAAWRTETTHATKPTTIAESVVVPEVSASEPPASVVPPVANQFLHEIGPLKPVPIKPVDTPKVELRDASPVQVPAPAPVVSPPASLATAPVALPVPLEPGTGSTVAPRTDTAITTVRPPKVVISPRLRRTPILSPDPLPEPVVKTEAAETPAAEPEPMKAEAVVPPAPEPVKAEAAVPPAPAPEPVKAEPVVPPAPAPVVVAPADVSMPAAPVKPEPVEKPKPATPDTSAVHAEEASAAERASHHAPVSAPAPAPVGAPAASVPAAAVAVPIAVTKPASPSTSTCALEAIAPPEAKVAKDAEAEADASSEAKFAAGNSLVPSLGERYHPAEREGGPNTDSSRHFPTRPFAPSGMTDKEIAKEAATERAAQSAQPAPNGVRTLTVWQRVLRFFLAVVCVGGVGYGLYWLSQSKIGKDPWGMEPGSGGPGDVVNKKAFEAMEQAAQRGNADAQVKVARAFLDGREAKANPEEALKWFRKAAEQGHVDAMYAVGDAYKNGAGVPQDNVEALKWYRRAEESREQQKPRVEKEEEPDVRLR
jgi:hypothetical protein